MLRRRPSHEIQSVAKNLPRASCGNTIINASNKRIIEKKSTNQDNNKDVPIEHCQKAVLDATVAFCCLDGRWFDSVRGMGLRELAQAFINIGAQFGTMP